MPSVAVAVAFNAVVCAAACERVFGHAVSTMSTFVWNAVAAVTAATVTVYCC